MVTSVDITTPYLVGAQITFLISFPIGFIGCAFILFLELKHRRQCLPKEKREEQRMSLIWSLCVILSSIITQFCFMIAATPHICDYYSNQIGVLGYCHKYIFLGLFQLQRLRKLFGESTDNYKLIKLINALYIGALMSPMVIVGVILTYSVTDYGRYGCQWSYNGAGTVFVILWVILYTTWDGTILVAYVYKLSQYRKIIKEMAKIADNSAQHIRLYHEVKCALGKILFLTLIYEIFSAVSSVSTLLLQNVPGEYSLYLGIGHGSIWALDTFISALVVYLMQARNQKHYDAFLAVLSKLHLTWCCHQLAHDANDKNAQEDATLIIEVSKTVHVYQHNT